MKLGELIEALKKWKKEKSLATAYDICDMLSKNLTTEDE